MENNATNYILVAGYSGVGKTRYIKRAINALKRHGYTTACLGLYISGNGPWKEKLFEIAEKKCQGERYCFIECIVKGNMEIVFQDFFGPMDLLNGIDGKASVDLLGGERAPDAPVSHLSAPLPTEDVVDA